MAWHPCSSTLPTKRFRSQTVSSAIAPWSFSVLASATVKGTALPAVVQNRKWRMPAPRAQQGIVFSFVSLLGLSLENVVSARSFLLLRCGAVNRCLLGEVSLSQSRRSRRMTIAHRFIGGFAYEDECSP